MSSFAFETPDGRLWRQGFEVVDGRPVLVGDPRPVRKGLGDAIAKVTKAVGIRPCGGCQERRARLNEIAGKSDPPA